jgi:hypothetical protein
MMKRDSEKDSERPHYYSQFWLDVAAGRKVIGGPRTSEELETAEPELQEVPLLRKSTRSSDNTKRSFTSDIDGHQDILTHPVVEPEVVAEPEVDVLDHVGEADDFMPMNLDVDDTSIPDVDITSLEDEAQDEEEEELYEEEEEEEEDDDWNASRGRKKSKPSRPGKQPPPAKPSTKRKREPRRGF